MYHCSYRFHLPCPSYFRSNKIRRAHTLENLYARFLTILPRTSKVAMLLADAFSIILFHLIRSFFRRLYSGSLLMAPPLRMITHAKSAFSTRISTTMDTLGTARTKSKFLEIWFAFQDTISSLFYNLFLLLT